MHQYQPTIIETRSLFARLLIQFAFLRDELKRSWIEFKNNPSTFSRAMSRHIIHRVRTFLSTPNVIPATLSAVATITCVIVVVVLFDKTTTTRTGDFAANDGVEDVVMLDASKPLDSTNKPSTGKDGPGRVGHKPESCRHLRRFLLRYQRGPHSIHQHFPLLVLISTPLYGRT